MLDAAKHRVLKVSMCSVHVTASLVSNTVSNFVTLTVWRIFIAVLPFRET